MRGVGVRGGGKGVGRERENNSESSVVLREGSCPLLPSSADVGVTSS